MIFLYPLEFGGLYQNIAIPFGMKKTRMVGLPVCDGRADRWTDGQTGILPRHSPRYGYS